MQSRLNLIPHTFRRVFATPGKKISTEMWYKRISVALTFFHVRLELRKAKPIASISEIQTFICQLDVDARDLVILDFVARNSLVLTRWLRYSTRIAFKTVNTINYQLLDKQKALERAGCHFTSAVHLSQDLPETSLKKKWLQEQTAHCDLEVSFESLF